VNRRSVAADSAGARHRTAAIERWAAGAIALLLGGIWSIAAFTGLSASAQTTLVPRLSAVPSSGPPNASTAVSGYDLAPLTDYQIQVCGNAGFGGSSICDLTATATAATSETGHFVVFLVVGRPPVPCPCVVKATPLKGTGGLNQGIVSTPITIQGVPIRPPVPPPANGNPSGLVVDRAELVGSRTWAEFFGDSAHRTLILRLRDAGPNLIPSTPFVLHAGPAGNPTQIVGAPFVPPLRPGQVVSYRVPVTFPPLAHGNYVVVGQLGNTGQIVTFRATASLMPWGLVIVLAVILLVALGLIIRRIVRRYQRRKDDAAGVVAAGNGEAPAGSAEEPAGETSETSLATMSMSDEQG